MPGRQAANDILESNVFDPGKAGKISREFHFDQYATTLVMTPVPFSTP